MSDTSEPDFRSVCSSVWMRRSGSAISLCVTSDCAQTPTAPAANPAMTVNAGPAREPTSLRPLPLPSAIGISFAGLHLVAERDVVGDEARPCGIGGRRIELAQQALFERRIVGFERNQLTGARRGAPAQQERQADRDYVRAHR